MTSRAESDDNKGSVLRRAFEILDCFDGAAEVTVAYVVERTGMSPATVHRMLASLVEWGGVERTGYGKYVLGERLWQLGVGVPQVRRLRDIAQPILVELHLATRGTVYLGVRNGLDGIYSDRITRVKSTQHTARAARRMPLHRTGGGRVLLAYAPDAWAQLQAQGDPALAPNLATLGTELTKIKELGVAVSLHDGLPGRSSVAAPVFGLSGGIIASISVAFPDTRIADPWSIVPQVRRAAHALTTELVTAAIG